MIPIRFVCACSNYFTAKSHIYKTAEKQARAKGWTFPVDSQHKIKYVCPDCRDIKLNN